MKKLINGVAYGIGMLILAYLAFRNPEGIAAIFTAGASGIVVATKTLQGR